MRKENLIKVTEDSIVNTLGKKIASNYQNNINIQPKYGNEYLFGSCCHIMNRKWYLNVHENDF